MISEHVELSVSTAPLSNGDISRVLQEVADLLEAWLPILHTHRGARHYTALFSNTARAHEMHTTHDWVVIYRDDHGGQVQWTVITSRLGDLEGRRIVRGREEECRRCYDEAEHAVTTSSKVHSNV